MLVPDRAFLKAVCTGIKDTKALASKTPSTSTVLSAAVLRAKICVHEEGWEAALPCSTHLGVLVYLLGVFLVAVDVEPHGRPSAARTAQPEDNAGAVGEDEPQALVGEKGREKPLSHAPLGYPRCFPRHPAWPCLTHTTPELRPPGGAAEGTSAAHSWRSKSLSPDPLCASHRPGSHCQTQGRSFSRVKHTAWPQGKCRCNRKH